jgi:hypothetical protein
MLMKLTTDGTEIWNPLDGTVQLASDDFPPLVGFGSSHSKLVPIKDGSELLLYGGYFGSLQQDGIWKFSTSYIYNSWTKFGTMLPAKDDHFVIPFTDIKCPK